jgi:hypothetical protein
LIRLPLRVRASAAALVAALALTGCSFGENNGKSPSPSTSRPQAMIAWLSGIAECMHDSGWDVAVDAEQSGITMDTLPSDQRGPFKDSLATCEKQAGPQPNNAPIDAKAAAKTYKHLVLMRACLQEHGVSTSEPPSQATFVDDYLSGKATAWSPFSDIPNGTEARWRELLHACPQSPPDLP